MTTGATAAAPFARFALHATAAASCATLASLVLRRSGLWPSSWPAAGRSRGSAAAAAQNGPANAEPSTGSGTSGTGKGAAPQSAAPGGVQTAVGATTTRQRRRAGADGGSGASQPSADDEEVKHMLSVQPILRLQSATGQGLYSRDHAQSAVSASDVATVHGCNRGQIGLVPDAATCQRRQG